MIVRVVTRDDFAALAALFERDHSPCYCRYWHFTGTNKEWEARCAFAPSDNRAELQQQLQQPSLQGLIALDGDRVIGWMKLVPQLHKLLMRSPYKGLESPEIWSIGCFLIDPEHRRRGVARALVAKAIELAPSLGIKTLEAYPRVFEGMGEGELWMGPMAIFEEFSVVRDQPQYPVLRFTVPAR